MLKKHKITILVFSFALIFPIGVFAHPGKTDSSGCHTCYTKCEKWGLKYNEYHCHNKPVTSETKKARTEARKEAKK